MNKIVPVLLAGGTGTRLWPVSRDALPKQFLPLIGKRSTYQETLLRVTDAELFGPPIVTTGNDFRFFAQRQAEELGINATVVIEPMRRILVRLLRRQRRWLKIGTPTPLCWRSPLIMSSSTWMNFARRAARGLTLPKPATLSPSASHRPLPKQRYGYIRRGQPVGLGGACTVDAFVEKPDAGTAARYVAENYLWNSGNFLFRADVLLDELKRHEPAMAAAAEASVSGASNDLDFLRLEHDAFVVRHKNQSIMR